jgi:hypothetical protein
MEDRMTTSVPPFDGSFSWDLYQQLPVDAEALVERAAEIEHRVHPCAPFDVERLRASCGMRQLLVRFITLEGPAEVTIGGTDHAPTWAEVLWHLHEASTRYALGNHRWFEGLTTQHVTPGGVHVFLMGQGS